MARLTKITIENYRSIGEQVSISLPQNKPVIFIGENNSGKTNIIRAIDLIFGEYHPKYKTLEDHDYFGRNQNQDMEIIINSTVTGMQNRLGRFDEFTCRGFEFRSSKEQGNSLNAIQSEDGELNPYVYNAHRDELCSVFVSSEQNLSYQLSYSSKFTLLSKVMKAFHHQLTSDEERVLRLKELFKDIKETFNAVEDFRAFKDNMSYIAGDMITNMTHGLQLDFSAYDPSNYFKTLRVFPTENNEVRSFEELGTGQQQVLALSFAHAYAKSFRGQNLILLVDEPVSWFSGNWTFSI